MKKFFLAHKHAVLAALAALAFLFSAFDWFSSDKCSPSNRGPFDGKVLYTCTVKALAEIHRGNIDPRVRQAWLDVWLHRFDNSNLLDDETGTLKAVTDMLMSMNERFDYFYTPADTHQNSIDAEGQIAGIGANIAFVGKTPAALEKLELPKYPTAQALALLRQKYATAGNGSRFDKMVVASDPAPGTPAYGAGLKAGDQILEINGSPIDTSADAEALIANVRGPEGSQVTLKIVTGAEGKRRTVHLVRQIIKMPAASETDIGDVGVVRIAEFESENTAADVHEALDKACGVTGSNESDNGCKANALIIDLRNNPGGRLDIVLRVIQLFVEQGRLVTVNMRNGDHSDSQNYILTKNHLSLTLPDGTAQHVERWISVHFPLDRPIVVLTNENTASGAEALAEMLQRYRNAIVVGKRTVGKGVGQCPVGLPFDYSLFPICMEYSIGDKSVDWVGVTPDVEVAAADGATDLQMARALEVAHNPSAFAAGKSNVDLTSIMKQRKAEFADAQEKMRALLGL
ncbi:MAG: S41 family peptidase [Candidatus Obscuribacterales bacterium]